MRKLTAILSAFILLLSLFSGSAFAEGIQVITGVSVHTDPSTKEVTVQGNHLNGSGQTVTIRVLGPDGSITYIDQVKTLQNGAFSFQFKPKNPADGNYSLDLSTNGNSSPYATGFHYNNTGSEGGQTGGGQPGGGQPGGGGQPVGGNSGGPNNNPGNHANEAADISNSLHIKTQINDDGTSVSSAEIAAETIDQTLNNDKLKSIIISINGNAEAVHLGIPATSLDKIGKRDVDLVLKTRKVNLVIPASAINLGGLADALHAAADQIKITIKIKEVPGEQAKSLLQQPVSGERDARGTTSGVFEFLIEATNGTDTVNISDFGTKTVQGELYFNDSDVNGINNVKTLNVYKYNEAAKQWEIRRSIVQPDEKKIVFFTNTFSKYTILGSTKTFSDIAGHWAKDDIELLAAKHALNGTTDRTFEPEGIVTRAQFAAMIVQAIGIQAKPEVNNSFSDLSSSDWYYQAVEAAAQAGIVNGVNDSQFAPNAAITREQITVMIMRAYTYLTGEDYNSLADSAAPVFTDRNELDKWAVKAVQTAYDLGIVTGVKESVFAPASQATRAQAAVLLKRLLEKTNNI